MGLLRSEDMGYGTMVLPAHDARRYIDLIGKHLNLQFEDMNAHEMRRPFRKHIQRIDECERICRFLYDMIAKSGKSVTMNRVEEFLEADESYSLDVIEAELAGLYDQFVKFKEYNTTLTEQRNLVAEEKEVAFAATEMFRGGGGAVEMRGAETFEGGAKKPLLGEDFTSFGNISGVINAGEVPRLQRAVFRASRGNAFMHIQSCKEDMMDAKTGAPVPKSVFVIYFQGATGALQNRVQKVCDAFGCNTYPWPGDASQASNKYNALATALVEKDKALQGYQKIIKTELADLLEAAGGRADANSKIEDYRLFLAKEKSIYSIMNMCNGDMLLTVNVWFPAEEEAEIHKMLSHANAGVQQGAFLVPNKGRPNGATPTYIRTNDFTEIWQMIVNEYGVPAYKEANPGILTLVTFPFTFGMMYGDVGHGTLLLCAGLFLLFNAESIRYSQPAMYQARYLIIQMSIYAIFAGFMYNDCFGLGIPLFDSAWGEPDSSGTMQPLPNIDIRNEGGQGPYPFGIDWKWKGTENELIFMNSFKMKLSVLMGVLQMTVGLFLRFSNAIHFGSARDLICECVPMLMFMLCFFGWMDFMILYKWTHPVNDPPNIVNSLICMAMGQKDTNPLWDENGGSSVDVANTLMLFAVAAVPMILLPKPIWMYFEHQAAKSKKHPQDSAALLEGGGDAGGHGHGDGEEFELMEVVIHQVIETIEYVLGTVSHTASYLRIWALSLAHQQLSTVFFEKTLMNGLQSGSFPTNGILLYVLMVPWFAVTVGVLLGMDVLECFLHTLRLHWVEFQSKFYMQGGTLFTPYSTKKTVAKASES